MLAKHLFTISILTVFTSLNISAQEEKRSTEKDNHSISFGLRYAVLSPSGTSTLTTDSFEINSDFPAEGTNASASSPSFAAGIQLGKYHLSLGANPVSYSVTGAVPTTVNGDGFIIREGTRERRLRSQSEPLPESS